MENKELVPFTHRIYTDFSGDDGDFNTPGASKCLCGAWILSAENDIRFNEGIVLQMKKLVGSKPNNEIKFKSLTHHPQKMEVLSLLPQLKAKIILTPVVKNRINDVNIRSPKTKSLLKIIHGFPLERYMEYLGAVSADFCLQLIIDEMSWSGYQKDVVEHLKMDLPDANWAGARADWLYFAKSGNSLMLQLADIVAGLGREFIEDLQGKELPPCRMCSLSKSPKRNCIYTRGKKYLVLNKLFKNVIPLLLRNSAGRFYEGGVIVRPPEIQADYLFIECLQRK